MAPLASKFNRAYDDKETPPSNNLWVGNLSPDTTDADLTELFAKFGPLDKVTTYSSRSFAFVYFTRVEDAKSAKNALQGTTFCGNPIKIEFAGPAKPSNHLWVGGISPVVSKEELEEEFLKFGDIQELKFLKDGNIAFVEYSRLEDASQAMENMNGKTIGGEQIRVDFLRSQPSRRIPDKRTRSISMGSNYPQNSAGLIILNNESIQSFLLSASNDSRLSPELRATALNLCSLNNVPYKSIRRIWVEPNPSTRPNLFHLFTDSEFVFTSPKPREKSEELKARLRKLAERAERDEYRELVKDIMPKNNATEPLSSYKDQLGFGIHVALIMFTGYLVGYFAFRALFSHSTAMSAAGGILGLVCGMLVETLLFIIRSSGQDPKSSSTASKLKKNQ